MTEKQDGKRDEKLKEFRSFRSSKRRKKKRTKGVMKKKLKLRIVLFV